MAQTTLALEIVTIERKVWEDDGLEMVLLPGADGELGILPKHTPLLTALKPGVIIIRKNGQDEQFAVGGGFAEVRPNKVTVLASTAEHSEEIDVARAEAALERARQLLAEGPPEPGPSLAIMREALMRSEIRLKVARGRRGRGVPSRAGGVEHM